QLEQAAAAVEVLEVAAPALALGPEVLGERVDALGQQGDLDLGGPGVLLVLTVLADELGLLLGDQGHVSSSIRPQIASRAAPHHAVRPSARPRGGAQAGEHLRSGDYMSLER